jgi:hypothetical protein
MACYLEWHNYRKRFLIKGAVGENQTHGGKAGIPPEIIADVREAMFTWRAFLSLAHLDAVEEKIWKKLFPTPGSIRPAYLPTFALN